MRQRASQRSDGEPDANGLVEWRQCQLERSGFDAGLAATLAGDRRYDLHAVLELVDRGCPPGLAARILAPLDEAPGPAR